MIDPALREAYAAARYRIDCGERHIERRIGEVDAVADAALVAAGCANRWHVLTPCNPGSQRLSDADNAARLTALRDVLDRTGWRVLPALNLDADGRWSEAGFCVLDAPEDRIRQLARECGQLAMVAGKPGAAPKLVWIDSAS